MRYSWLKSFGNGIIAVIFSILLMRLTSPFTGTLRGSMPERQIVDHKTQLAFTLVFYTTFMETVSVPFLCQSINRWLFTWKVIQSYTNIFYVLPRIMLAQKSCPVWLRELFSGFSWHVVLYAWNAWRTCLLLTESHRITLSQSRFRSGESRHHIP